MTSTFSVFLLRSQAAQPQVRVRQYRIVLLGFLLALAGCGSASRGVIQTAKTVTSVALSPASANIAVGATQQFTATVNYSDGTTGDVTSSAGWAVTTSSVATVDGNGLVKGVAAGSTTVTAVVNGVTGSASITVTAQTPTVKSITVAPANLSITVGATQQYQASATFSDGSVKDVTASATWTSSNPSVASISASGVATAAGAGTTTITAAASGLTANTTLTVTSTTAPGATLSSIAITPATPSIAVGATQQFTATGTYSDGTTANITSTATWTSSNTAVATINAAGLATGVTAGSATITAALNGVTATAALTITSTTPPPATLSSIAVTPPSGTVAPGATQQFTATASYSDGTTANVTSTATWVSANTKVATITAGLAKGVAAGSTTITATLNGVSGTATLTVSTTTATLSSIAVTPANPSIAQGATQQFTATATYSDGTTGNVTSTATWSSSDTKVATISTAGVATAAGTGTATITATLNSVTGSTGITVTSKTVTSIAVTPATASFAAGNTQQFKATATYADSTTADITSSVTWTSSDTSFVTINSSGLATGVASGSATITAALNGTSGTASVTITAASPASTTNIPTWHVNNSRTGLNSNETALTPSTVNASKFGKLWSYLVDGYVYGEPLVMSNLTVNGATHNVLFAATEADSVYAFDLDSSSQTPLWKTSLLQSGETPLPSGVIQPYVGVTSTPVIDTSTNTMYVVSVQKGSSGGTFRLNALDITTGAQKFGGPKTITASVPGTATGGSTVTLTTGCTQRAALLLANGNVYIGVGGCPTGWLLAYNASTLAQVAVWNASPNQGGEGPYASAGGVWMGAGGPVADSSGNIYVTTGNGPWNGTTSLSDSVVKFDASLHVLDYFTPQDWAYLFCDDTDLAAGGLMMIPGTSQLVAGGKAGKIFVVNSGNLGHEQANDAGATQSLWFESDLSAPYSSTCTDSTGSHTTMINSYEIFGTSAWYNGSTYLGIIPTASSTIAPIRQFAWDGSKLTPGAYSSPSAPTTSLGTTPFISSNGNSNGIVWMIDQGVALQKGTPTNATLYAYDATNFANQLYNSKQNPGDTPGYGIKFTSPVVANGKVFISTGHDPVTATNPQGEIDVYGLK